ncbi:hypothetical protein CHUAL_010340 [Chamberlinius hualienensis]
MSGGDSTGQPVAMSESSRILTGASRQQQMIYSSSVENVNTPVSTNDTENLVLDESIPDGDKTSTPCASFNYINSIIGSGIIGMPYALQQAGFGLGIILLFVVAAVTDYSLVLLIKGGLLAGTKTYQGLMEAAYGRPGFYILSFIQFVYPMIAMISYNIIIGDTITKVVIRIIGGRHSVTSVADKKIDPCFCFFLDQASSAGILANRNFIVAMVTLLVTLPLSLFRQMSQLAKVSFISLVFIIVIVISILVRLGTLSGEIPKTNDAWQMANTGVMQSIGVMAFAYMCHHNSFLLYDSLLIPSQRNWNKVTHASIVVALVLFLLLSIGGYATFTGYTQGDVLENYCMFDDLMNFNRFLFSITIMLTYPIECFVSREVIENVLFASWTHKPTYLHVSITVVIVAIVFGISLLTDCLGIVLELNGVAAAVPLAYILPAICYLKLETAPILSWQKLPAIFTALFGTVVAVVGLILTFANPSDYSCSHGQEMEYCEELTNRSLRSLY